MPFNLVATLIFFCAIVHTFMAGKFSRISHERRLRQKTRIENGEARPGSADIIGEVCHFLGEVEVIFGLWTIPLIASIVVMFGWQAVVAYFDNDVNLTEPAFVVAIMVLASTRPILKLAESVMLGFSRVLGGSLSAFYTRLFLFIVIAVYGSIAVAVFDAFWPRVMGGSVSLQGKPAPA